MGMEWPPRGDLKVVVLTIVLVVISNGVSAIEKSDTGAGQYLIVPFAIANANNETLIEISDSTRQPVARALKLRVLDRDGQPRLTANLYLARGATWAGGLTREEGAARLVASSDSCLLVEGSDGIEAPDQVDFDFNAGSLEVVEMGIAVDPPLAAHVHERDCEAIVDLWNDGAWSPGAALAPPAGDIRVGARIINVAKGALYGVPATALKDFSNIVQHSEPGSAQPDLASTQDEGTAAGQTRSEVCVDGECIEDFWENPVDAASAVLMSFTARDTYNIADSLAAESEWVVTYPTVHYYEADNVLGTTLVSLLVSDRSGQTLYDNAVYIPEMAPSFSNTLWLNHERSVNLLNFRMKHEEAEGPVSTGIFGLEEAFRIPNWDFEALPESGRARLGFESFWPPDVQPLVAPSGRTYWGRPAIVTTFTEYTNGVLPGEDGVPQRANYGSSGEVSTTVRISQPES